MPAPVPSEAIVGKLRAAMTAQDLDAVLPMAPENIVYVAGVVPPSLRTVRSRLACGIVPIEGPTELIVIALEEGAVKPHNRLDRMTTYREFEEDAVTTAAASLRERGLGDARIGVEATYLPKASFDLLEESLPGAQLVAIDDLLAEVRSIKTPEEVSTIADIGSEAQRIGEECLGLLSTGETEAMLGETITQRYEAVGGRLTMLVVGSGSRSALANAPPTDKVIEPGDVVRIDVIGVRDNYCSDVARTAVVGEPSREQRDLYGRLKDVHERILASLRPGAMSDDLYGIYRDAMAEARLPYYHFVGHGLGITLHEDPFINDRKPVALAPGMVLCVEPMSLIQGRYGMQIEDEILITEDGCRPLTRAGDLMTIEAG